MPITFVRLRDFSLGSERMELFFVLESTNEFQEK